MSKVEKASETLILFDFLFHTYYSTLWRISSRKSRAWILNSLWKSNIYLCLHTDKSLYIKLIINNYFLSLSLNSSIFNFNCDVIPRFIIRALKNLLA